MTFRERTQYHWRIAFCIWLVVLTIATHVPQGEAASEPIFESPDKLLHMVCFGVLAFLFMCTNWLHSRLAVWIVVATWAVVDELLQNALPINRPFSIEDVVAGQLGIAAAMVWRGSLHSDAVVPLREQIDRALARPRHWILLGCIAFLSSLGMATLLWFALTGVTGTNRSAIALFVGIVVGTLCVLVGIVRIGRFDSVLPKWKKGVAIPLITTICATGMLYFFASITLFDPWVIALTSLVFGCRLVWSRLLHLQVGKQS